MGALASTNPHVAEARTGVRLVFPSMPQKPGGTLLVTTTLTKAVGASVPGGGVTPGTVAGKLTLTKLFVVSLE